MDGAPFSRLGNGAFRGPGQRPCPPNCSGARDERRELLLCDLEEIVGDEGRDVEHALVVHPVLHPDLRLVHAPEGLQGTTNRARARETRLPACTADCANADFDHSGLRVPQKGYFFGWRSCDDSSVRALCRNETYRPMLSEHCAKSCRYVPASTCAAPGHLSCNFESTEKCSDINSGGWTSEGDDWHWGASRQAAPPATGWRRTRGHFGDSPSQNIPNYE